MDPTLKKKLDKILKINENIDVVPIEKTTGVSNIETQPSIFQPQENIAEIINKQTEMIISIIKQLIENQNTLIKEIIESHKTNNNYTKDFQEKIITLNLDDKGNPISATVKLNPFNENELDLEELEKKEILEIDMGE